MLSAAADTRRVHLVTDGLMCFAPISKWRWGRGPHPPRRFGYPAPMPGLKTKGKERRAYEVMGSWSQHVASWMGMTGRPVHLMRYEDLLASPERSFGALARFLRLEPNAEQLKRAIAKSSFEELRRQEAEHGFNERPEAAERFFREGRAGQWPRALSQQQIEDICSVHAPIMQRFGYLLPDCGGAIPLARAKVAE